LLAESVEQINHTQDTDAVMTTCSDEALVCWISDKQHGWCAAFTILITRYRPWIYRRCQFRLGNHDDAEDATQDIVMRLYAKLHQFKGRSKFRSWLNRIIDNYCNTFAVRRARYATGDHIEQLIELHQQEDLTDPYSVLAEQEQMRKAVSALPANARQVICLRFYGEFSLQEIARMLKLTLSAAKARLYRAIEQLKLFYNKLDDINPFLSSV
jgi:RNA polymerase sigma-70 factor (ECF subfamily)